MKGDMNTYVRLFYDDNNKPFLMKVKTIEREDGKREVIKVIKETPSQSELDFILNLKKQRN